MAIEAIAIAATQEVAAGAANIEAAQQLAEKVAMQTTENITVSQNMTAVEKSSPTEQFQIGEITSKEIDGKDVLKQKEADAINELRDKLENDSSDFVEMLENKEDGGEKIDYYIQTRNESLKGDLHPITGVLFEEKTVIDCDGNRVTGVFPDFDSTIDVQLPEDMFRATDADQFTYCNKQLQKTIENNPDFVKEFTSEQLEQFKNGDTPDGCTWHHNEDPGKMQLVDSEIHARTGHTGGRSIWGGGSEFR